MWSLKLFSCQLTQQFTKGRNQKEGKKHFCDIDYLAQGWHSWDVHIERFFTWIIIALVREIDPLLVLRSITLSGWSDPFGAQSITTRTSTRRIINVTRWAMTTHKRSMSSILPTGRSTVKLLWSVVLTRRSIMVSKPWNDSFSIQVFKNWWYYSLLNH